MTTYGLGKDFIIKVGDGGNPEAFTTLGGIKSNSFAINNEIIDATTKDNPQWKTLLSGGIKSVSLSGSGVMNNSATAKQILAGIFSKTGGDIMDFKIVATDGHSYTGPFFITAVDDSGDVGKEEAWSVKLESAGEITYAAAP